MTLPLRDGGLGLCTQSDDDADAAFVAGAGQAESSMKGRPAALCPPQGASGSSVQGPLSSLQHWDAEQ